MKLENLNIIIADDHPLFRNALRLALSNAFEHTQWFEADSAEALQHVLDEKDQPFDLILLDLQMPGSHHPDIPVVVIAAHEDINTISRAIHYGSSGFIPKSASMEVLEEALNAVLYGDIWLPKGTQIVPVSDDPTDKMASRLSDLTPQQYRVLQMLAEGLLNKQIAYDFGVSEATIKAHATAIFRKLGVRNRTQAVIALQQLEMDRIDIS